MGTTSEELKKLYKKLGGKDPKVAGFSAPGEILNAINEIPLPTEYELPTVTTEDAGDVLVVNEEGKWDKGEAGGASVVPNPEGEATADLTKLGVGDTVYGIPKELPAVTGSDNGNALQVVEGAWAKAAIPSNVAIHYSYKLNNKYYLDDNESVQSIFEDAASGKFLILVNNDLQGEQIFSKTVYHLTTYTNTQIAFNSVYYSGGHTRTESLIISSSATTNEITHLNI